MSFTNDPALTTNQLPISLEIPRDPDQMVEILQLYLRRIGFIVNNKTGGLYNLFEQFNSNLFYTTTNPQVFRNVYRKTFDVVNLNGGPIAPSATVTFPHNITGLLETAHVEAAVTTNSPEYFTVVFPNAKLNATNLVFTNPTANTVTKCTFIAEYLKN